MRLTKLLLLTFLLPLALQAQEQPFKVIGFFADFTVRTRDYVPADIPANLVTHLNYAFALPKDINNDGYLECAFADDAVAYDWQMSRVVSGTDITKGEQFGTLQQLRLLKRNYPHLKILLSLGGACATDPNTGQCVELASVFSAIAHDVTRREHFLDSCVSLMARPLYDPTSYDLFDGIDIDWEFPTASDTQVYTQFIASLRTKLDALGNTLHRKYLLTVDGPASPFYLQHIDIPGIEPYVDWINVMAYGLYLPQSWAQKTGYNAALASTSQEPFGAGYNIADLSVGGWQRGGMPSDKLVLGLPYYGVGYQGVEAGNNPLFPGRHQPFAGSFPPSLVDGAIPFGDLTLAYQEIHGYISYWDNEAFAPFKYNPYQKIWISYDSPNSIDYKTSWAIEQGLKGVFMWQLALESTAKTKMYPLTEIIAKKAKDTIPKPLFATIGKLKVTEPYPNPAEEETKFMVQATQRETVNIQLFDLLGRKLRTLYQGALIPEQIYTFNISRDSLASGTYIYRVQSSSAQESRLVILK